MRIRLAILATALAGMSASPAAAHGVLPGVRAFYTGLLHVILVTAEALAILAVGLALGVSGKAVARVGLAGLACGLSVGLVGSHVVSIDAVRTTSFLLAIALLAAALVAGGLKLPQWIGFGLALFAGLALGFDAAPEAPTLSLSLTVSIGTLLGGMILCIVVLALVLDRKGRLQALCARVVASWIASSSVLYLAWLTTVHSTRIGPL